MGSSRPTDRSLGEATFLPQWMKGKLDTRFDYTESTFSPPADDTFFYIHYPKYQETSTTLANSSKEGFRPINEVLGNKTDAADTSNKSLLSSGASKDPKEIDFSKHPLPCHPFIPITAERISVKQPKLILANKVKHEASDDEFRNPKTAECGRSIVHVASQIMSSRFGKSNSSDSSASTQNQVNESANHKQQQTKVSRSLPATPLASPNVTPDSSPKVRRRVYANRFFTGAFVPDSSEQRHKNGWLLSSILGQSREIITPKIEEEDEQSAEPIPSRALSRKKSISSQNLTYVGKEEDGKEGKAPTTQGSFFTNKLQPKPSELREMNFWTPTSM